MLEKRLILKVALVLVMALAFCFTAMADKQPLPSSPSLKAVNDNPVQAQEEARQIQQAIDYKNSLPAPVVSLTAHRVVGENLKRNPYPHAPRPAMGGNKVDILFEGFESGLVPPAGWTPIVNNDCSWEIDNSSPFEGTYNASIYWDSVMAPEGQNEWLVSPVVDLGTSSWVLEFAWMGSYAWSVDPNENCDLTVKITTDGGANWIDLWNEDTEPVFEDWTWYEETIDLSTYSGNVQVAFVYTGYDGAQFSFDAVSINDAAIPTGRCCYGDPSAPSCTDEITEADCLTTYSGRWTEGIKCDDVPCPLAPANDTWEYAIDITGACPVNVSGTTISATLDCPGVLDWKSVWYKFTVPYEYNRVDIDYCGTAVPIQCVGIVIFPEPFDCSNYIVTTNNNWDDCGDDNPSLMWQGLPAGTYYFSAYTGDADCVDIEQDFQFTYCVTEVIPPENDDADKAISVGEVTDLPFSTALATFDGPGTCQTCANVWFCYTATTTGLATIDLCGSTYDTKLAVYEGCEVDGSGMPLGAQLGCNDDDTNGGGSVCEGKTAQSAVIMNVVAGNSYLIEIGGYYSSYSDVCNVGDGDLSINVVVGGVCCDPLTGNCTDVPDEATCLAAGGDYHAGEDCATYTCPPPASEGDNCGDPIKIDLPGDLPYTDANQYTCGRWDDYTGEQVCYSPSAAWYGDGEDIIYEITVSEATTIGITIDPKGTSWTYCQIMEECPPVGATCVYYFRNTGSTVYSSDPIALAAGTYYMMLDTYPDPECIPDYDITLTAFEECDIDCPSGSVAEAETCGDDTNGGCSADPPTEQYEAIVPGTTVCGTVWADTELRDLDWYEFVATESGDITWTGQGEFPIYMWILNAEGGCEGATVLASGGADPCTDVLLTAHVSAGTYWLLVGPSDWLDIQCGGGGVYGTEYYATFTFVPGVAYCDASGGCDEYISNVNVGAIDNTTTCDGYADFTGISTTMAVGVGYPITITLGTSYSSDYGAVWVDWNQDYDFEDADEAITLDVNYGVGPYTGTIMPPAGALDGATRMRVRVSYDALPPACGTTQYGEAEDYTIVVGGTVVEPILIIDPETMHYADGQLVVDEEVTIWMGGSELDFDVNDVEIATVTVNGIAPLNVEIGTNPDMTGDVLVITMSKKAFVQSYGLIWTGDPYTYTVAGDNTGGAFSEVGDVTLIGHIPGDINKDGQVNVLDIISMINAKYKGGAMPTPIQIADVNADGNFNVLDIVYLIDYKFKGGPIPMHP